MANMITDFKTRVKTSEFNDKILIGDTLNPMVDLICDGYKSIKTVSDTIHIFSYKDSIKVISSKHKRAFDIYFDDYVNIEDIQIVESCGEYLMNTSFRNKLLLISNRFKYVREYMDKNSNEYLLTLPNMSRPLVISKKFKYVIDSMKYSNDSFGIKLIISNFIIIFSAIILIALVSKLT